MTRKKMSPLAWSWFAPAFMALLLSGCRKSGAESTQPIVAVPPPLVETVKPVRRTVVRTVELPGDVEPYQQAMLYAKVAGYLRTVLVDQGDQVRAGQLLATIESPELKREADQMQAHMEKARADLVGTRAELLKAYAERDAAEAQLRQSRETYTRLKRVYDRDHGLLARQDLDMAETKVRVGESQRVVADKQIEVTRAKIQGLSHQVQAAEEAFKRAASWLSYTQIRAPFSGTITQRLLDPGTLVQSAVNSAQGGTKPLFALVNMDTVRILVQVSEPDAPYVHQGTKGTISTEVGPRLLNARVSRVAGALDPSTRTMPAEIELRNPDHRLTGGMFVKVSLNLEAHHQALSVPAGAVLLEKDTRFLLLVKDGKADKVAVTTGFEGPQWIEIVKGLHGNEEVILAGKENVSPGLAVRLKPREYTQHAGELNKRHH